MKNSVDLNIKLNTKSKDGRTVFHTACMEGRTSIVEMMIDNSESLRLSFKERDIYGELGWTTNWHQKHSKDNG